MTGSVSVSEMSLWPLCRGSWIRDSSVKLELDSVPELDTEAVLAVLPSGLLVCRSLAAASPALSLSS